MSNQTVVACEEQSDKQSKKKLKAKHVETKKYNNK